MTDTQFWFVSLLVTLAFALVCVGSWIKFGPGVAMIIAGFLLAWVANLVILASGSTR